MRKYLSQIKHHVRKQKNPGAKSGCPPFPHVSLTQWRSGRNVPNFGDDLSSIIVSLMLSRMGKTLEDEAKRQAELVAIGSVIHLAGNGATIWGSGINGKVPDHFHRYQSLDVRAVRGPLTREWLKRKKGIDAPEIYGDPALLLPILCQGRFVAKREVEHVFVPNLNDMLNEVSFDLPDGVELVSPMQSWHKVVSQITRAGFVSSSSLHGLVIAEAFGIPARYVRLSETENLFKYQDYYAGTGRDSLDFALSVSEAAKMGGAAGFQFDPAPLLRSFPIDLWCTP